MRVSPASHRIIGAGGGALQAKSLLERSV